MIPVCCVCGHLILDGQRIRVMVDATYHVLKSTLCHAIDKNDMEPDSDTLCHKKCPRID